MEKTKPANVKLHKNPYFLIAIVLILIFLSITIYSGEWPPVSVVESSSMEHSAYWTPGVINTGDMVFVKRVTSVNNVVTYVQGRENGYSTYGEYGNVILYRSPGGSIIIHRAIMYISWSNNNLIVKGYNNQSWIEKIGTCVVIRDMGFSHRNFSINVANFKGISGFITMGDNNLASQFVKYNAKYHSYEAADQTIFNYPPVNISNVVGIAFGQIPWLGLIKLNILGLEHQWPTSSDVAKNSYLYLGLTIMLMITVIILPYDKIFKRIRGSKR
jgi:signal peptidase